MMIIDPVLLGSTTISRPGPGTYFDSAGVLQSAANNVLRISHDPSNPSAPPLPLVEKESTNWVRNNTMLGAVAGMPGTLPTNWQYGAPTGVSREVVGIGVESGIEYIDIRVFGTPAAAPVPEVMIPFDMGTATKAAAGQTWVSTIFVRIVGGSMSGVANCENFIIGYSSTPALTEAGSSTFTPSAAPLSECRVSHTRQMTGADTAFIHSRFDLNLTAGGGVPVDITLRIGLPQLERDSATSPIKTSGAAVTRAADVVSNTPGLLYSNVTVAEAPYNAAISYAKGDLALDPTTNVVYESLVAANSGAALSDATKWLGRGATNRWRMLDQYNNTQTENQDQIYLVLSPKEVVRGVYLGNLDAHEVSVIVQDGADGTVFSATNSLVIGDSDSSYFNWCFKRIRRRTYFVAVTLPVYVNALVTIIIRKPGGIAKCGMCVVGPIADVGLSEYGLSTEIKDYSSTTFNFDGTSTTVKRGFAKRMSVDVQVSNEVIDSVQEMLADYRQKPVVWVGTVLYGSALIYGTYSSFKNIIETHPFSKMALQIEGKV